MTNFLTSMPTGFDIGVRDIVGAAGRSNGREEALASAQPSFAGCVPIAPSVDMRRLRSPSDEDPLAGKEPMRQKCAGRDEMLLVATGEGNW